MTLKVVHHPAYVAAMPPGHRFPMGKFAAVVQRLLADRVVGPEQIVQPELAPSAWIELAHAPDYVGAVLSQTLDPASVRRIGFPVTAEIACRSRAAIGGTVLAARLALSEGLACNLAGGSHHAFTAYGSGFCVFNDVAIASRVLLAEGTIQRALVVDLDVHQGDGTAAMLADEPRAITFSIHCRTNFPARKQRSDLDLALDAGVGDGDYLHLLALHLPDLLDEVRPDLVFFNAGVDPHVEDRLGRLALSANGLWRREELVLGTCLQRGIPVAGVLGGGYAPDLERLAGLHSIQHRVAGDVLRRLA
jgi:acetoin utilization deacetylase AcuC-like enzyme